MMSFLKDRLENMAWPNTTIQLISRIQEFKGKQALYQQQMPEVLSALRQIAVIQSTESSNRIEGIVVSEQRLSLLMKEKVKPRDRSEAEVAGYRDVLETIHASAPYMMLSPNLLLQMHRDLMAFATGNGGKWKSVDKYIREILPTGEEIIRFTPVPAINTPDAVQQLCSLYREKRDKALVHELILVAAFVLDFLCIHPFSDGNGRMARLLSLLLLYQSGYEVGRYISLEKIIEESKEQYYETLYLSSQGWHEGKHDPIPWLDYFLTVILKAYQRFEERIGTNFTQRRGWKKERIEKVVSRMIGDFTISDIEERCPGISRPTISRVLNALSHNGVIVCLERGRNARWRKTQN